MSLKQYTIGGVVLVGLLAIRALLLGVYIGAPDFWKLPCWLQQLPVSLSGMFEVYDTIAYSYVRKMGSPKLVILAAPASF